MFNWFKRKSNKVSTVRIKIEESVAFVGEVESFDISTDIKGSDAYVVVKLKASDIVRKLMVSKE